MGFLVIQPKYQAYAVKLKIKEHPTAAQLVYLLQNNPPGNLAEATDWFRLLASRVNGVLSIWKFFFQLIIKAFPRLWAFWLWTFINHAFRANSQGEGWIPDEVAASFTLLLARRIQRIFSFPTIHLRGLWDNCERISHCLRNEKSTKCWGSCQDTTEWPSSFLRTIWRTHEVSSL